MLSIRPCLKPQYGPRISPHIANSVILFRRSNSTAPKPKPTPALVQRLRKQTSCSIQKAIQALSSTGNDYETAVEWLSKDLAHSAQKTVAKLDGRSASSGLVAISPLSNGVGTDRIGNLGMPLRVGMVELNCETGFVARSEVFEKLARNLAWSAGFYAEHPVGYNRYIRNVDVDSILDAPMIHEPPPDLSAESYAAFQSASSGGRTNMASIRSAIANTVTQVGEKIVLKRAASISSFAFPLHSDPVLSVGLYAHNSTTPKGVRGTTGTVAAAVLVELRASNLKRLVLLGGRDDEIAVGWRYDYRALERALARQVVGFETVAVKPGVLFQTPSAGEEQPGFLYDQEFHTYASLASQNPRYEGLPLSNVKRSLEAWSGASGMDGESSVEVLGFLKWKVAEESEGLSPLLY